MQRWREMRALGYPHAARTVSRFITVLRRASEAGLTPEVQAARVPAGSFLSWQCR